MSASDNMANNPYEEISNFGEKVFSYCLQKFGVIYKELASSPLFTEDIGNAVVILQIHMRDLLRDQFCRGLDKMVTVIDPKHAYLTIKHLLEVRSNKDLDQHSIFTVFLGYLALITELIIFLDSVGYSVPKHWFKQIWTTIYEERLEQQFAEDWDGLKCEAEGVCEECKDKELLFEELKLVDHPYTEIDPLIETPFKELDPFFMFCSLGMGFEYPRRLGLSSEAQSKLLRDPFLMSFITNAKSL